MKPQEILKGNRVSLKRPLQTFAEANERYALIDKNRNHLLPWLDWAMENITQKAEDCFNFLTDAYIAWDNGNKYEYTIFEESSQKIIGSLGVWKAGSSIHKHFELAFWLAQDACSKGYMQEAIKLIEKEFFALGVKRLVIRNEVRNTKSKNVGLSLGYEFEGVQKSARYSKYLEKFIDINVFAKINKDV